MSVVGVTCHFISTTVYVNEAFMKMIKFESGK